MDDFGILAHIFAVAGEGLPLSLLYEVACPYPFPVCSAPLFCVEGGCFWVTPIRLAAHL